MKKLVQRKVQNLDFKYHKDENKLLRLLLFFKLYPETHTHTYKKKEVFYSQTYIIMSKKVDLKIVLLGDSGVG